MKRALAVVVLLATCGALAQVVTTANQGAPGKQGPWPVTIAGSLGDGGAVPTMAAPCTGLAQILTDAGTAAVTVPVGGPTANRVWIQICNTVLNASTSQCICASNSKPASFTAGVAGDVLGQGDCATYNITAQDGGVPWCICNAANVALNSTECVP